MRCRYSIVAIATLTLAATPATAAELPTFELLGFPITRHQVAAIGAEGVHEQSPTPALTFGGMPASPHQIAVLMPRPSKTPEVAAEKPAMVDLAAE